MFHRTQRLLLRPAWPEDWRGVFDGVADETIIRNLASAPWPYGEQDAKDFVALPVAHRFPRFLLTLAKDSAIIGSMGIDDHAGTTELGYWVARPHWGRGYATEAGRAVIAMARMLGHGRLSAGNFTDNPASSRVLRKLGFVPTGMTPERFSLGRASSARTIEYRLLLHADVPDLRAA